jgi:hypothetical protein
MTRRFFLACAILALSRPVFGQDGVVRVGGAVPHPLTFTREAMPALPRQSVTASAHDQSARYDGVLLIEVLKRAGAPTGEAIRGAELAKSVVVTGADGYRVVFALAELDAAFTDRIALLADKRDGAALPDNALPYQLILTGEKRPARWVRRVVSSDVVEAARTP